MVESTVNCDSPLYCTLVCEHMVRSQHTQHGNTLYRLLYSISLVDTKTMVWVITKTSEVERKDPLVFTIEKHKNFSMPFVSKLLCFLFFFPSSLCCRLIPGPNRELPVQDCVPGSSIMCTFFLPFFPLNGLKLLHPQLRTGLHGTTERISAQIEQLCFARRLWIWNQTNPLYDQRASMLVTLASAVSCGQFPTCSLSVSSILSFPENLGQLSGGYLQPIKPLKTICWPAYRWTC